MAGKKCNSCIYQGYFGSNRKPSFYCCDYFVITGKRRPCAADDDCSVYKKATPELKEKLKFNKRQRWDEGVNL